MKNNKRKRMVFISIAAVIIILIIIFMYFSQKGASIISKPFTITNSTPTENALGVSVFDPITITFNQPVDSSSVTVTSNPSENWTTSQITPNTVKVGHELYLRVSTTYKLTISQNGNAIETLTFVTAHEQNDPRQLQGLQSDLNKNYPLASLTPYETSDYRVIYSAPLTLEIDLKNSIGTQEAITQVQAWVKSNGVDPGTHKYNVVNVSPTP